MTPDGNKLTQNAGYFSYWGKARPQRSGAPWHLLPYHCLDVAAVSQSVLQANHRLRQLFALSLDVSEASVVSWLGFLVALHDMGKFSHAFQKQSEPAVLALQGKTHDCDYDVRHDTLGYQWWREHEPEIWQLGIPIFSEGMWEESAHCLIRAVTGHHGQPPSEKPSPPHRHFIPADTDAAMAFTAATYKLLVPEEHAQEWGQLAPHTLERNFKILSHWLSGLTVLADWLGSNQVFFPYVDQETSLTNYWETAKQQAADAIAQAGVVPSASVTDRLPADYLPYCTTLTPLQHYAQEVALCDGPQLFILEDVTGSGKTEAALILAHRLLAAGKAAGLYIGLPTMATANGMYTRVAEVYARLFLGNANLVLAHSAAFLDDAFQASIIPNNPVDQSQHANPETDETASARCTAWLADNRKKALLADVGVGTIDQALQAVLPNKHQSLRLLGLFGKVLIVDEVHAFDAYMHTLLCRLLEYHALSGGSVILLSATLPQSMRQRLVNAFSAGRNWEPRALTSNQYPLATHLTGPAPAQESILQTRDSVKRKVGLNYLSNVAEVHGFIESALATGQCICWIRNTVKDAIAAHRTLTERGVSATLFHSKFTLGDRLEIETDVLHRFGKDSGARERSGQVLIATQVVEQSLDVDFDQLITDLAPIDNLIQRAGRLQRHTRTLHGDVADKEQRPPPELTVLGPQPADDADEDWYGRLFETGQYVYPNHAQLWLGAKLLINNQGFSMPDDARVLIEGVYGENATDRAPRALHTSHQKQQGEQKGDESQANWNTLKLEHGYAKQADFDWWEDAVTPSRLGEETVPLRFVRWDGRQWVDWHTGPKALHLSQVQINAKKAVDAVVPTDAQQREAWGRKLESLPDQGRWSRLTAVERINDEWRLETKTEAGRIQWTYSPTAGLQEQ